ncbi:hypothetical protein [Streptomyces tritici]|uniref:hypothetical protein n=1 Tax=Streptomyces tritici TaxID=2054410 RepID=UPI003AF096AA
MLPHATAPAARFIQIPHDIVRHPRLNAEAVRLLVWQLSLPEGVYEPLWKTAERAGVKNSAFTRAKKQLKEAGYVHEWREQGARGRWQTVQLASNVPLSPEEAVVARAVQEAKRNGGEPPEPPAPPAPPTPPAPPAPPTPPAPPAPPTPASPAARTLAVGDPEDRSVGDYPKNTLENTSNHPAPEARRVLDAVTALDPRLRVPRGMVPELVRLVGRWLEGGHSAESVREEVRRCLPGRDTVIHRPGGLLRYVLREVAPVPVAPEPPRPPRVASMRECEGGGHIQPLLFTPVGDEVLCRDCRSERAAVATPPAAAAALRGVALLRASLAR